MIKLKNLIESKKVEWISSYFSGNLKKQAEKVESLMYDWWWQSRSDKLKEAIKILKKYPELRKQSIKNLIATKGKPNKVWQHVAPDDNGGISYTIYKSVADRFADESGGDVNDYSIGLRDIFYYTGNSEGEIFLNWDIK